jgi:hypothetical protein
MQPRIDEWRGAAACARNCDAQRITEPALNIDR